MQLLAVISQQREARSAPRLLPRRLQHVARWISLKAAPCSECSRSSSMVLDALEMQDVSCLGLSRVEAAPAVLRGPRACDIVRFQSVGDSFLPERAAHSVHLRLNLAQLLPTDRQTDRTELN